MFELLQPWLSTIARIRNDPSAGPTILRIADRHYDLSLRHVFKPMGRYFTPSASDLSDLPYICLRHPMYRWYQQLATQKTKESKEIKFYRDLNLLCNEKYRSLCNGGNTTYDLLPDA